MASIIYRRLARSTSLLQNPKPQFLLSDSHPFTTFISSSQKPQRSDLFPPTAQRSNFSSQRFFVFPANPITIFPGHDLRYPIRHFSKIHLDQQQRNGPSTTPDPTNPSGAPPESPEFRHQEITGPTVERDNSALANETRQVLESLQKAIYDLSLSLVLLGTVHLGLGAWIAYAAEPSREVTVQGIAAFAFPFTLAFLMRRTLKPLSFFGKMEEQGRLQVLTLAMQSSKNLRTMFLRVRIVAMFCMLGVSVGSISAIWIH